MNPATSGGRIQRRRMIRIVSGGQTGVDRGALDAALERGFPCGGWVPAGRKAEDGTIPARYPVQVLQGAGYRQRTRRNVRDSDGTVIIYFGHPTGGTEATLHYCLSDQRPYLLIDALEVTPERAAARIAGFVQGLTGGTLNIAGPRHSTHGQAHEYARRAVGAFLAACT
jgi:hypothetical protein